MTTTRVSPETDINKYDINFLKADGEYDIEKIETTVELWLTCFYDGLDDMEKHRPDVQMDVWGIAKKQRDFWDKTPDERVAKLNLMKQEFASHKEYWVWKEADLTNAISILEIVVLPA